jgi:hypothetical protein
LAYEFVGATPGQFGNILNIPVNLVNAITKDAAPFLQNLGCPINPNDGSTVPGS